jgi:glutathione S-transferase
MPPITLHFLQASRSIRIAWLLSELNLDYAINFADRKSNLKAPEEFKASTGNPLGKSPSLQDGDVTVYESGAITEYDFATEFGRAILRKRYKGWREHRYICEHYDKENRLIPQDVKQRVKVLQWIHAAEGTFMLHAIAITYARWNIPKDAPDILSQTEKGLSVNVQNDLDWLETELSFSPGPFLCGDKPTAADTMMQFSIDIILVTNLGTQGRTWPGIESWLKACKECESYKKAVEKTGYELSFKVPE